MRQTFNPRAQGSRPYLGTCGFRHLDYQILLYEELNAGKACPEGPGLKIDLPTIECVGRHFESPSLGYVEAELHKEPVESLKLGAHGLVFYHH